MITGDPSSSKHIFLEGNQRSTTTIRASITGWEWFGRDKEFAVAPHTPRIWYVSPLVFGHADSFISAKCRQLRLG
jgi:hypothetical protein